MRPRFQKDNLPVYMILTDHIAVFINATEGFKRYAEIVEDFQAEIQAIKEDVDKIDKFLDYDVELTINPGESRQSYVALAEPVGDRKNPRRYSLEVHSKQLFAINHELFHVVDKAGSSKRLSNQKEFKPLIKEYKKFINQHNKYIDIRKNIYANGTHTSELFARLMEHWVHKREGLNYTIFERQSFDKAVTEFYAQNYKIIDDYFDTLFADKLEAYHTKNDNEYNSHDDYIDHDFSKSLNELSKQGGQSLS